MSVDRIKKQLTPYFKTIDPIQVIYLFGSVISNEDFNDIDVAVFLLPELASSPLAFQNSLRWGSEAEKYLNPRTNLDLRVLNDSSILFQFQVIKNGVVLWERNRDIRVNFETYVLNCYLDYLPTKQFFDHQLLQGFSI